MSDAINTAKLYIQEENYKEALKLAKKRHAKDDIEEYLAILDLLINEDYLLALEEKGMYYQYFDETHDNGDMVKNTLTNTWKSNPDQLM